MAQICYKWGNAAVLFKLANWKWSECAGEGPIPPVPVIEVGRQPLGVDATTLIQPWSEEPWNPYRAGEDKKQGNRKMIEMLLRVLGEEYSETKEKKTFDVGIEDVRITINPSNIDLKLKD